MGRGGIVLAGCVGGHAGFETCGMLGLGCVRMSGGRGRGGS